jgi:hypothetical protein
MNVFKNDFFVYESDMDNMKTLKPRSNCQHNTLDAISVHDSIAYKIQQAIYSASGVSIVKSALIVPRKSQPAPADKPLLVLSEHQAAGYK